MDVVLGLCRDEMKSVSYLITLRGNQERPGEVGVVQTVELA